jgi:hypothetical protein
MIWSKTVLRRIAPKWSAKMMESPAANLIGGWCVEHFRKYGQPPKRGIASYLESHEGRSDFDAANSLLGGLTDGPGEINKGRLIDVAGEWFNRVRLRRLQEGIAADVEANRLSKAEEKVAAFSRVEMGAGAGIDLFQDKAAMEAALTEVRLESLITYHQPALDAFFRNRLIRDGFLAFLAPEKTGKTTVMIDLAVRAMLQQKRVAYFSIGDEPEEDLHERFLVRMSSHPFRNDTGKWPLTVRWPTRITKPAQGEDGEWGAADTKTKEKIFDRALTVAKAEEKYAKIVQSKIKSDASFLKTSTHASLAVGVSDIRSVISSWQQGGWSPDLVIIDYADNLADPAGTKMEPRHAIHRNWQEMRALNKELHCLLVTATQATRDSYDRRSINRKHVSEDKRKLADVTGVIAINAMGEEKEKGIIRLAWAVARHGRFSSKREIHCAGCWDVGNPCIVSDW